MGADGVPDATGSGYLCCWGCGGCAASADSRGGGKGTLKTVLTSKSRIEFSGWEFCTEIFCPLLFFVRREAPIKHLGAALALSRRRRLRHLNCCAEFFVPGAIFLSGAGVIRNISEFSVRCYFLSGAGVQKILGRQRPLTIRVKPLHVATKTGRKSMKRWQKSGKGEDAEHDNVTNFSTNEDEEHENPCEWQQERR